MQNDTRQNAHNTRSFISHKNIMSRSQVSIISSTCSILCPRNRLILRIISCLYSVKHTHTHTTDMSKKAKRFCHLSFCVIYTLITGAYPLGPPTESYIFLFQVFKSLHLSVHACQDWSYNSLLWLLQLLYWCYDRSY